MSRILITGAAGMVGSHLLEHLAEASAGVARQAALPRLGGVGVGGVGVGEVGVGEVGAKVLGSFHAPTIDMADIEGRFCLAPLDVTQRGAVADLIAAFRPDTIYHLAAQSLPVVSWQNPWETMEVNVIGTVNVFEAIKALRLRVPDYDPMVVVACSSAQYGASLAPANLPIGEDTQLLPLHPYGVSKVAQDLLAFQYWCNDRIRSIRARIFNCTGPRKRNDVVSDFAARIAAGLRAGQAGPIVLRVGNLETRRAILDVRDLVTALTALAAHGSPGEAYNICAEQAHRIADLVGIFEHIAGRTLLCQPDPALYRPSDEPIILGSSQRLHAACGWRQAVSIEQTLARVLAYEMDHPRQ